MTPDAGSARWATVLAALSILLLATLFAAHRTTDFDVLWHIRTGDWILAQRTVPTTDPFGVATAGRPWLDVAWGAQVPMALVASRLGVGGLHLLMIAIVVATLAIVVGRGPRTLAVLLASLLFVLLGWPRFMVRPDVLALPLTALLVFLIDRLVRSPSRGVIFALAALCLLWVNLHGSFVLVPILTAAAALGALAAGEGRRSWRAPAVAISATVIASWINPRGPRVDLLLLPYARSLAAAVGLAPPAERLSISEWTPLWRTLSGPIVFPWLPFVLLVALVGLSFFGAGMRSRAPRLALAAAALALAVLAIRNQLVFATVALCTIVLNERDRLRAPEPRAFAFLEHTALRTPVALGLAGWAAVLCAQVASDAYYVKRAFTYTTGVGLDLDQAPEGAARWLATHRYPGVAFNGFDSGAYLFYRLYPAYRPFIDARVVDPDAVRRVHRALADPAAFEELVAAEGIGTVVLFHPWSESVLLLPRLVADPRWRLAFRDHNTTIHVRTDLEPPALREPPWSIAPADEPMTAAINAGLARLKRSAIPTVDLTDAFVSGILGDGEREHDAYRRALERAPDDPMARAYFASQLPRSPAPEPNDSPAEP